MRIVRSTTGWTAAVAVALCAAGPLQAQYSTKMPSTLRWGSGHVDVPSAGVLPHMAITGTYSGFWVNLDNNLVIGPGGAVVGITGPLEKCTRTPPSRSACSTGPRSARSSTRSTTRAAAT